MRKQGTVDRALFLCLLLVFVRETTDSFYHKLLSATSDQVDGTETPVSGQKTLSQSSALSTHFFEHTLATKGEKYTAEDL